MTNALDVKLQDDEQFDEIQLLAELMVQASESLEALDLSTIDATLGLDPLAELPSQRRGG
jgi:hypothetical protein